jgi:hypothetical protein
LFATWAVEIHIFVTVAALLGARGQRRRVEPGVRLGDGEARLGVAARDRRQHAPLLLLGAEHHHRIQSEDVHVDRGGAAHRGAGFRDRLHHDGGIGDAEPGAPECLGQGDAEPAAFGDRPVELMRKRAVAIARQPIGVVEARAELRDRLAQLELVGREGEIHARLSPSRRGWAT